MGSGEDAINFFELVETYADERKHIFNEVTLADDIFDICRYVYLSNNEDQNFWQHFVSGILPDSLLDFYPYQEMNAARVIAPFGPGDLTINPRSADVELLELD